MTDALHSLLERGQRAMESGQFGAAVETFREATAGRSGDHTLAMLLARAQQLAGEAVGARETLLDAYRQRPPADAAVSYELGAALLEAGAPREAAACFLRVTRARPTDPAPLAALAGAKRAIGEPVAALAFIEEALAKAPDTPAFLLTAAQIHHDLADLDRADQWLALAARARPQHGPTRVQRAYTTLLRGPSGAGWADFEWRPLPVPDNGATAWNGEPLHGASILVTAEQGVGDQFQFLRFVPRLHELGAARVIVQCHADAVALLTDSGFDAVPRGTAPPTQWHVPMMSLPHRLRLDTTVDAVRVPYLRARDSIATSLPPRASATASAAPRRLGLVWAGNPAFVGRVTRDLDVALLPLLLSTPNVEFIALQHGDTSAVNDPRLQRVPLSTDWSVTARMLTELDGLVTTDTGIAHLAGAMGIRTWVLLQHVPDWRWGLHGDTCAWYPTHTLVRQPTHGDWRSVIDTLCTLLNGTTP